LTEKESENKKTVKLQKVESKDVKQTTQGFLNLKEARVDSAAVQTVQKGLVSAASVGQVRQQIEQAKSQAKDKSQNQQK